MRTGYKTRPYEKSMEIFQNFTGGLNTTSPPDGMLDSELNDILNEDISERGSLKRRHGLRKLYSIPSGSPQGYFRYYTTTGSYVEFVAVNGKIYFALTGIELPITGLSSFQTTRMIEAVQFGGTLYIATGTKLLTYDGTTCKVVDPYVPSTIEMTYIGSNALADNPESNLTDSTGLVASIDYVMPNMFLAGVKIGSVRVYSTLVSGETYEYAMQVRGVASKDQAWPDPPSTAWKSLNSHTLSGPGVGSSGDYEIRVQMRKTGTTSVLSEMVVPVTVATFYKPTTTANNTIHQCNRVLMHWGRLMLYGDQDNPDLLYMSHLNTPNYFPSLLTLQFDNPRREALMSIIHYRNSLIAFTKTSTQALYGTGPDDYRRVMLHTDLGCISPYGAAVMKNGVGFLSTQGVYSLKTMALTDDKATVEKLDLKIDNLIRKDAAGANAIVIYNDSQLQITYPVLKTRFRYYYELGAWTKDYSERFYFSGMWNVEGDIFGISDGALYQFDKTVFNDDDYNYENMWESKYLSFGQPYHPKKLKELQVLTAPNNDSMTCTIYVFADEQAVITPDHSYASVVNGVVVWNAVIEPNFHISPGIMFDSNWILGDSVFGENMYAKDTLKLTGKCLRTRIRVSNTEPKENHFIGFAYIFKTKKP